MIVFLCQARAVARVVQISRSVKRLFAVARIFKVNALNFYFICRANKIKVNDRMSKTSTGVAIPPPPGLTDQDVFSFRNLFGGGIELVAKANNENTTNWGPNEWTAYFTRLTGVPSGVGFTEWETKIKEATNQGKTAILSQIKRFVIQPTPPGLTGADARFFYHHDYPEQSIQDFAEGKKFNTSSWGKSDWVNLYIVMLDLLPGSSTVQDARDATDSLDRIPPALMQNAAIDWYTQKQIDAGIPDADIERGKKETQEEQDARILVLKQRKARSHGRSYGVAAVAARPPVNPSEAEAKAKAAEAKAAEARAADHTPPMSVSSIAELINKINASFSNLLPKMESQMKKNDINPQLKKMTQFISEINDSLPMPTSGGGTRRANIKKRKKTLRSGRYR